MSGEESKADRSKETIEWDEDYFKTITGKETLFYLLTFSFTMYTDFLWKTGNWFGISSFHQYIFPILDIWTRNFRKDATGMSYLC